MHDLPRQLSAAELARVFEGRTRLVERLTGCVDPLGDAETVLRDAPEDELVEALNTHPRIGARTLSARSAREQGKEEDPAVLAELARLNERYEETFGFRFVVFVKGRPRSEILQVLRRRITRSRQQELRTAIIDLFAIAADRYRTMMRAGSPPQ